MPEQVQSFPELDSYPDRFLTCRALAHRWSPVGTPWAKKQDDNVVIHEKFHCDRCDAERTDQRSLYGHFLRRSYNHEAHYKLPKEANKKDLMAKERYRRIFGPLDQLERTA